jgi:hypothetical protein
MYRGTLLKVLAGIVIILSVGRTNIAFPCNDIVEDCAQSACTATSGPYYRPCNDDVVYPAKMACEPFAEAQFAYDGVFSPYVTVDEWYVCETWRIWETNMCSVSKYSLTSGGSCTSFQWYCGGALCVESSECN